MELKQLKYTTIRNDANFSFLTWAQKLRQNTQQLVTIFMDVTMKIVAGCPNNGSTSKLNLKYWDCTLLYQQFRTQTKKLFYYKLRGKSRGRKNRNCVAKRITYIPPPKKNASEKPWQPWAEEKSNHPPAQQLEANITKPSKQK